jgi:hypothetical protein
MTGILPAAGVKKWEKAHQERVKEGKSTLPVTFKYYNADHNLNQEAIEDMFRTLTPENSFPQLTKPPTPTQNSHGN